jgi:hypothetical protein
MNDALKTKKIQIEVPGSDAVCVELQLAINDTRELLESDDVTGTLRQTLLNQHVIMRSMLAVHGRAAVAKHERVKLAHPGAFPFGRG